MNYIKKFLQKVRALLKKFWRKVAPAYRTALRVEINTKKLLTLAGKQPQQKNQDYLFWIGQNRPGELLSETKRRVFANLPPAEGIVHECQIILNFLLKEMDDVCRQNGLSYWLMGGTLIGAIRHKSFIPWDDDADIGMMRYDYERLKEVIKGHPYIDLLDYYNFNRFFRIPKIVVRGSESKMAIDIIVFDYTNAYEEPLAEIWRAQQKIRKAYMQALKEFKLQVPELKVTDLVRDPVKFQEVSELTRKYIELCGYSLDDGDTVIWGIDNFTSSARDKKRIYTKESIFPLKELEFEGKTYYVVNDYMEMITREAGDIWSFPSDAGTPKKFSAAKQRIEVDKAKAALDEAILLKGELCYYRRSHKND